MNNQPQRKKAKGHVVVHMNSPDGPVILRDHDSVDIRTTNDGKDPKFDTMPLKEAIDKGYKFKSEYTAAIDRQLRIFDLVLRQPKDALRLFPKKSSNQLLQAVRNAEKMVIEGSAMARIANAIKAYPEMLVVNGEFALPPFKTMWVEFNLNDMFSHFEGEISEKLLNSDERVGYLFIGNNVYTVADSSSAGPAGFIPVRYELHTPMSPEAQKAMLKYFNAASVDEIDMAFWGSVYNTIDPVNRPKLRMKHSMRVIRPELYQNSGFSWRDFAGDLRNLLGILLMLHQPKGVVTYRDVAARKQLTAKGIVKHLPHRVVDINLGKNDARYLLMPLKKEGDPRVVGHHSVIGHYCHNKQARHSGCDHGGGEWWVEYEPKRWECLNCGGRRWWREYPDGHGDKSRPVKHVYRVKG